MAVNVITAWLRLRDRRRFSREAAAAARDIREINKAADEGQGIFEKLGGMFSTLAEKTSALTPRTRIFGFAIGTVAAAAVAAIPLIVGLGGAVVAVTASFAAAAIGAGLLAGALVGVLGAGLGAVGLVAFDFMKNFQDVNERFQTWRNAVAAFGRDSKQAQTAFSRLAGVIQNDGGPAVYDAVKSFQELRDTFEKAMEPSITKMMGIFARLFDWLTVNMPFFSGLVTKSVDALIGVFQGWGKVLAGPEIHNGLVAIFNAFSQLAGPIGQGVGTIFLAMFRLVTRMLPFLQPLADGFSSIADSILEWATSADLQPFLDSLNDWWGLLKAVGGLMVTVFSSGKDEGDSLVTSLTDVINGWNAILSAPGGKAGLVSFFKDAVDMTKSFVGILAGVVGVIFKFGRAAVPIYTKFFDMMKTGWGMLMDALAPMKPFWDNVLGPFLSGLLQGIGGTLFGAFKAIIGVIKIVASVLGWIGKTIGPSAKGFFEGLGKVVGFIAGGPILKFLSGLGKISIILRPLAFVFKLLYAPIRLVGGVLGWLGGKALGLIGWLGRLAGSILPGLRSAWNSVLGWLTGGGLGGKLFDAGIKLWGMLKRGFLQAVGSGLGFAGDIAKAIWNFIAKKFNHFLPDHIGFINLPNNPLPLLAGGGVVSGMGSWITGEAGPELNTLTPSGTVVVKPLAPAIAAPRGGTVEIGENRRVMVSKVYLRGKQIAEAVADEAEDDAAAKGRRH